MRSRSATLADKGEAESTKMLKIVARGGANCVQEQLDILRKQKPHSIRQFLIFSTCDFTVFEPVTPNCIYKRLYKLMNQTSFPEEAKVTDLMSGMKKTLQRGRTLKELARTVIRERLNGKVLLLASKLGLPNTVEDFLTYSECV